MTADRASLVKKRAEDLAVELIEAGLVTDDPELQELCSKLMPYKDKLAKVDRGLIQKALDPITPDPMLTFEPSARKCLKDLVEKLWGMRHFLGML